MVYDGDGVAFSDGKSVGRACLELFSVDGNSSGGVHVVDFHDDDGLLVFVRHVVLLSLESSALFIFAHGIWLDEESEDDGAGEERDHLVDDF